MKLSFAIPLGCSLIAPIHAQSSGNAALTNPNYANMTIWQAIEQMANQTSSSANINSNATSIQGIHRAFLQNQRISALLNSTSTAQDEFFAVFLPLDATLQRYNLLQQLNQTNLLPNSTITVPLALPNNNGTHSNITRMFMQQQMPKHSMNITVSLNDFLSYHVGNLTALEDNRRELVFPHSFLLPNATAMNRRDGAMSSNSTAFFNGTTSGLATFPTLLNATQFFGIAPQDNPVRSQVLVLNQTCSANNTMTPALSRLISAVSGFLGKKQFLPGLNATAEEACSLQVKHGLLNAPTRILSTSEAQKQGLLSNVTVANGVIYILQDLLNLPVNLTAINQFYNATASQNHTISILQNREASEPSNMSKFFQLLNQTSYYPLLLNSTLTLFALNDAAMANVQMPNNTASFNSSTIISQWSQFNAANLTDLDRLMANQIVNGTAYYSSILMQRALNAPSIAGSLLSIQQQDASGNTKNRTILQNLLGLPIQLSLNETSANSTASGEGNTTQRTFLPLSDLSLNQTVHIQDADLLLSNGVVHQVDKFFNETWHQSETSDAVGQFSFW
jgi:hypothetical protein